MNNGKQDEQIKPLCLHGPKLAHDYYFLDLDLLWIIKHEKKKQKP